MLMDPHIEGSDPNPLEGSGVSKSGLVGLLSRSEQSKLSVLSVERLTRLLAAAHAGTPQTPFVFPETHSSPANRQRYH